MQGGEIAVRWHMRLDPFEIKSGPQFEIVLEDDSVRKPLIEDSLHGPGMRIEGCDLRGTHVPAGWVARQIGLEMTVVGIDQFEGEA